MFSNGYGWSNYGAAERLCNASQLPDAVVIKLDHGSVAEMFTVASNDTDYEMAKSEHLDSNSVMVCAQVT